jgi:hypothetical protein
MSWLMAKKLQYGATPAQESGKGASTPSWCFHPLVALFVVESPSPRVS